MEKTILQAYKTLQNINRNRQEGEHLRYSLEVNGESSEHVSIPVIMMVPGVHTGSHGSVLHTAEGLEASASLWNGIPVVIHHPQDASGSYISANSEGVRSVGTLINARWEDGKLRANAVLEWNSVLSVSPDCATYIEKNRPLDVSIGAFTVSKEEEGEWNGESYHAIALEYTPDHLALLPGEEGACSWSDGCGVRVNSTPKINNNSKSKGGQMKEKIMELLAMGINVYALRTEEGYQATVSKAYTLINSLDSDAFYHYIEEVFDDVIIYRRTARNIPNRQERMFQQAYVLKEDGTMEFTGDPVPVSRQVSYKTIENNSKTKGESEMNRTERVAALIANGKFTKCDEQMLLQASEEQFAQLEANGKQEPKPELTDNTVAAYIGSKTQEQMLELLPESVRESVKQGLESYRKEREQRIEAIMANSKEFSKEELETMSDAMLEKLNKAFQPGVYLGQGGSNGGGKPEEGNGVAPLLPLGVK